MTDSRTHVHRMTRVDIFTGVGFDDFITAFETAAPRYTFLNRLLAVGTAEIGADGPVHLIEEIL